MTVFDCILLLYKSHQSAESRLTHIELEWEATDPQAHIQHFVDHATRVLDMEDSMWKQLVVHELQVIFRPDLLQRPAELFGALGSKIGTYNT